MQLQTPPISKAKEPEEMKMEMEEEEDLLWKNGFSVVAAALENDH